jgi:putative tricarboxylic transport membrane protein
MFVAVVGLGLMGLGVLLLIQIARGEVFEPEEAENAVPGQAMDKRAFFTALLGAIVPALTIETLGLPVAAMLAFMLVARAFGSRRIIMDLVVGFVLAALCWFMFGFLGLQLGGFFPLAGV